jgi:Fur family transcriptional regulator, ferric uptake regulator
MPGKTAVTNQTQKKALLLKQAGKRLTAQRALIMDIIHEGHMDADEIHKRARRKEPKISLSTVYRNLQTLKNLGLIEELHLDDTHHHYELKPIAEHDHIVCLGCGKVIEFKHSLHSHLRQEVPEAQTFAIIRTEIRITGYCPECRRKQEALRKDTIREEAADVR